MMIRERRTQFAVSFGISPRLRHCRHGSRWGLHCSFVESRLTILTLAETLQYRLILNGVPYDAVRAPCPSRCYLLWPPLVLHYRSATCYGPPVGNQGWTAPWKLVWFCDRRTFKMHTPRLLSSLDSD